MFCSFPKGKRKFHKNSKNIQKIEKYHYGFIPNPNRMEKAETERKGRDREKRKIITPFRSFPTGKRKFQKNSKKIQKIQKYHYGFIPRKNRLENAEKWRK